jgi:predicted ester cyclase
VSNHLNLAQRYYERLGARDLDGVSATLAPDVVADIPGGSLAGRGAVIGWMSSFFTAIPDIEHDPSDLRATDDGATADLRIHGTHTGPLVGPDGTLPPTGARVEFEARNSMTIADGAISSLRIEFDSGDVMRRLGAG